MSTTLKHYRNIAQETARAADEDAAAALSWLVRLDALLKDVPHCFDGQTDRTGQSSRDWIIGYLNDARDEALSVVTDPGEPL